MARNQPLRISWLNLKEFEGAMDRAADNVRESLNDEWRPVMEQVAQSAKGNANRARTSAADKARSGSRKHLADSYNVRRTRATKRVALEIRNRLPYAAGSEWGARGKWSGFTRYGPRGKRFLLKAVETMKPLFREGAARAMKRVGAQTRFLE